MGSSGINGSPNSEENVGVGSVTPTSVPGILAVKPVTKWYMAASAVRREMGGNTPKASQVKNSTTLGVVPMPLVHAWGYARRGRPRAYCA